MTSPGRIVLVLLSIAALAYLLIVLFNRFVGLEPGLLRAAAIAAIILLSHALYFVFPAPLYAFLPRLPVVRSLVATGFNKGWNRYRYPGFRPPRHQE